MKYTITLNEEELRHLASALRLKIKKCRNSADNRTRHADAMEADGVGGGGY